jgi:WD repeat-containing protein 19
MRVYRQMGQVGMVWSLETIAAIEDRALLGAHAAVHLHDFDTAERLFLQSTRPKEALEVCLPSPSLLVPPHPYPTASTQMRRDLLHWQRALQLAARLAPEQTVAISKEYAQQLEFTYV